MDKKVIIGIVIIGAVVVGGVFLFSQNQNSQTANQTLKTVQNTQLAADFTLPKYDGTGNINLASAYKNKPTVIQFWATWCPICRSEFPQNQKTITFYKDKINYLAVDWGEGDRQAVADYIKDLKLDTSAITFLMDTDRTVGDKYGVRGMPVHVFIKRTGEISFIQTGSLTGERLEEEIKKIL